MVGGSSGATELSMCENAMLPAGPKTPPPPPLGFVTEIRMRTSESEKDVVLNTLQTF